MSYFKQRLHLFRYPAFRLFLISALTATLGNGLSYVVITWLVVVHFKTMGATALLALCFWLPNTLLGPLVGIWADRLPSKWFMVASGVLRTASLFCFAWYIASHSTSNALFLFNVVMGSLFCLYWPAATKFVRRLVPKSQLLYANATIDMAFEVGNVIGMASAGFILAVFSPSVAIAINGACFLIATLSLILIKKNHLSAENESIVERKNLLQDFRDGLTYIAKHNKLALVYCAQLILFCQFMLCPVLLAPFAKLILHANALQFGEIEAALSTGVIMGSILTPWLVNRFNMYKLLLWWSIGLTICFALFGYSNSTLMAKILYLFIGLFLSTWPILTTRIQELTDITYQARTQSSFNSVSGVIIIAMYLMIFLGKGYVSMLSLFWLQAVLSLITVALVYINRHLLAKPSTF